MDLSTFREEVRQSSDIISVVEEYGVSLKRRGKVLQGLCPFHKDEKTRSFTVYPEDQSFYCFGCHKGGDVFNFVQEIKKFSFPEALRELALRAGITPLNWTPEQERKQKEKQLKEDILGAVSNYYSKNIPERIINYLTKERGLTKDTIISNKIGYVSGNPKGLMAFLEKQGYKKEQAIETGVFYRDGQEYFLNYIVFPNIYFRRVIYLTGRGYPEKSHKKPLKDKLPLNHLFFEEALRKKEAIIAEGEMDTYTFRQAEFNACGILGAGSFKDEWLIKFKKLETVYISGHNDIAGRKVALKLGELLKNKARMVSLPDFTRPDGKKVVDWNELFILKYKGDIQSFRQDYQKLLDQAQTVLEFKIRQIPKDIPERDFSKVLAPIIMQLKDLGGIEQDFYINIIVDHFPRISRQAIRKDLKRTQKSLVKIGEEDMEILDNYPKISPALDFIDGIGYVSIPLDVKLTTYVKDIPVTKIAKIPFLITSTKEFFRIDKMEFLEKKGLIFKSQPLFLGMNRWSLDYVKQFREDGFKVDPFIVFQEVKTIYEAYLDFKEPHTAEVIALWTIGTYVYPIFQAYPYISFAGERGSGKTKTLNVAEHLCFNAVLSSDMSSSLLFRIIEGSSCTVLIDEAERLKDKKLSQDFRLLLNAGYKRGGRAHRSKPDTFEPQSFDVYSPKMIANTKGLEEVLESRCIQFIMLRTKNIKKSNKVVTEMSEDWASIRHLLYAFGLDFFLKIQGIYLDDTEIKSIRAISGREGELWHPLLAIAKFLDKNGCDSLFERIKGIAVRKGEEARSTGIDNWTNALLLGLRDLTLTSEVDIYNKDIREKLIDYLEEGDSPPSPHWVGNKLRSLGLIEQSERTKNGYQYVIRHKTVVDVIERYGI